jgi:hypothetical protein
LADAIAAKNALFVLTDLSSSRKDLAECMYAVVVRARVLRRLNGQAGIRAIARLDGSPFTYGQLDLTHDQDQSLNNLGTQE